MRETAMKLDDIRVFLQCNDKSKGKARELRHITKERNGK